MNDFTKDELIDIYLKLEYFNNGIEDFAGEDPIIKKIQSMIYNYCEHEPDMNFANDDRPRYIKAHNPKCKKCGEFYR